MRWRRSIRWIHALLLCGAVGCRAQQVTYFGDADLNHYRDKVLAVEYPNIDQATPESVAFSQRPRTIKEPSQDDFWEMTLLQAVHTAVTNNKMIRSRLSAGPGTVNTTNSALLTAPANVPSVYDPALRETGFLFGNRGVEAALADFDAQLNASTQWGNNATVQNSFGTFVNNSDTGSFTSSLSKTMANGGNFTVNHNWNYLSTNSPFVPLSSSYAGTTQAVYTQPLWAGAGVEYNRIAGVARSGLGSITGVSQGVSIARINSDISVADFELAVTQMVKDVEDCYWDLYLAYRNWDATVSNRKSVLRSWVEVKAKMDAGARGGSAADEAQARENYFTTQAQVEQALSDIFVTENQFRKLLGLAVNDGKIIRPHDDPMEAEFVMQWESSVLDALTRRAELRRQKWQIKSLELQLRAAENVANPQLNLVSAYQLNGFGSNLLQYGNNTVNPYNSMYSTMGGANLQGWYAGLQFSMPVGLRTARMQLHNIELQLVKARATLSAQEQDINHDLAEAVQKIDAAYKIAQTQLDRKVAAVKRVDATTALYEVGARDENNLGVTLDLVLRAQAANAAAEIAYFTSLITYNKAITEFHWRRGMLLDIDGINLAEAEWDAKSMDDALKRAWARSFGTPNERLQTKPEEFGSSVPYPKTDLYPGLPQGAEINSISAPTDAPAATPTAVPQAPALSDEPAKATLEP